MADVTKVINALYVQTRVVSGSKVTLPAKVGPQVHMSSTFT